MRMRYVFAVADMDAIRACFDDPDSVIGPCKRDAANNLAVISHDFEEYYPEAHAGLVALSEEEPPRVRIFSTEEDYMAATGWVPHSI